MCILHVLAHPVDPQRSAERVVDLVGSGAEQIAGGARRSLIDLVFKYIVPDDIGITQAPVYYDYQLFGTWRPNERDTIRFLNYGSSDAFEITFDEPAFDDPALRGNADLSTRFFFHQIGWDRQGSIVSERLSDQVGQALQNITAVLQEAGASPRHLVRMTWYLTDLQGYRLETKEIGARYREVIGEHYPAMSLFEVSALLEPGAKVEIEATAVIEEGELHE